MTKHEKEINRIERIKKIDTEKLLLRIRFTDGFEATVSLEHIFASPKGLAAEVMRGGMFKNCFVESGALAWPNGLEFCPDAIRMWIEDQKKAA